MELTVTSNVRCPTNHEHQTQKIIMSAGQLLSRCFYWFFALTWTLGSLALQSCSNDEDYLTKRGRILAEESQNSLGGQLELGSEERAANDVLMAAKQEEVDRGFRDPSSFLPARNFMAVIEEIRRSNTFQIIRRMPKGAILHVHEKAILSSKFIYENITFRENLHICRSENGRIAFRFLRTPDTDTTCTSSAGWELLADLRANASIAEDVNTIIWNALTMVVPDPVAAYPDANASWTAFHAIFYRIRGLMNYLPVYEDWHYQSLAQLHEDNVLYVEVRSRLPILYDLDGKTYGPLESLRLYKATVDRFVNDHPDFIGAKLIYSPSRPSTTSQLTEALLFTAAGRKEFPDFMVGFDLVGLEDTGKPLVMFADTLSAISPDIGLFLHAGETKWSGLRTDENLIDAVLLNSKRIGHGYALPKHPMVLELVKQRGIAIEVNPISNQVLNLVDDMRNHPASFLFSRDFPVVVSCDDPGLWGAVGLSYDFYEAFVGIMSRSADIRALKQLAINSIKYSSLSIDDKARALTIWQEKWSAFIRDIVRDNVTLANPVQL